MATIEEKYLGDLRVECRHVGSGATIITDAPLDNNGKGEAFSPTDLCAAALGACAMTIMGIFANRHQLDIRGARIEINKVMAESPRRIGKIEVIFHMPELPYTEKQKAILLAAANSCPVKLSMGADVEQVFTFIWPES